MYYDYDYEQFISWDKLILGSKGGVSTDVITNTLDAGFRINGQNIKGRIYSVLNPQLFKSYNFNRLRTNSKPFPTTKFYNVDDLALSISEVLAADLKNYNGGENYINRDKSLTKNRNSNTHILFQIESELVDKDFFINSITFQYIQVK